MFRAFVVCVALSTTLYSGAARAMTLERLHGDAPAVDLFPETLVPAIDLGSGEGSADTTTGWVMVAGGVAAAAAGVFLVISFLPYAGTGSDLLWIVGALSLGMTVVGVLVAVAGLVLAGVGVAILGANPQVAAIDRAVPLVARPVDLLAARDRTEVPPVGQTVIAMPVWRF